MLKSKAYVFVLWSDGFDEMVATAFVTELRDAGLRVKVVGLTPRQISGARGLALIPDLTLDQALLLASQAICVIIPIAPGRSKRLDHDPRLSQFFEQASSNQALFITSRWHDIEPAGLELPAAVEGEIMIYPETETIVKFAHEIGKLLARRDT
ncbi:MAG: DJ-1/PfpI family protein [Chloroflexi bacterium]|nr:DJ-1/PfpI family protein [Chloroflexota bacterium]